MPNIEEFATLKGVDTRVTPKLSQGGSGFVKEVRIRDGYVDEYGVSNARVMGNLWWFEDGLMRGLEVVVVQYGAYVRVGAWFKFFNCEEQEEIVKMVDQIVELSENVGLCQRYIEPESWTPDSPSMSRGGRW